MSKLLLLFCLATLLSLSTHGQQYKFAPFQVKRSALIEEIKALKAANPKLTPDEWAQGANAILEKDGVNSMISFDAATCDNIKRVRDARKDPNIPIRLNATLKSVEAEAAALALPEPQFTSDDCGGCFIEIPVLQLTDKDFVTVVSDRNIKFVLPGNFSVNAATLVDPKNGAVVKRKWLIPFRSTPIGVSFDENVLYLGFNDPDLADLSLLVFGEGTFEIGTRKEADEGGPGKIVEPGSAAGLATKQIRFDRWKNTYLVSFGSPCPR